MSVRVHSLHSLSSDSSVSTKPQAIKCHRVSNTLDPFDWFQQIFVTRNSSGPRAIPRSSSAGIEALFNPLQLQVLTKDSGWITIINQPIDGSVLVNVGGVSILDKACERECLSGN